MYNRLLETNAEAKALHNKSMKANAEARRDEFREWNKLHGKKASKKVTEEVAA
jgi:hypothetical protein